MRILALLLLACALGGCKRDAAAPPDGPPVGRVMIDAAWQWVGIPTK